MKELIEIQSRLKAPKNNFNKFGNYKYRSCEDILEALKPLLKENGCHLTINDDVVIVGSRTYVKATARLLNSAGECIETSAFAREEETKKGMDGSQITGASSSYARKYALNGMFCIDDTKDSDTTNLGDPDSEDVHLALQEINGATTTEVLKEIFNNYAHLQRNKVFMGALTNRKNELLKNGTK